MDKFKTTLEAFLNKEIKHKELTVQLEQLLEQNPESSTQLLSDLTNWHKAGNLPQEIYIALKFQIEQFDEINQTKITLMGKPRTILPSNPTNHSTFTSQSTWSIFQEVNGEEAVIESGMVVRNTYRLIKQIGRGGMSVVWKAISLVQEAGDSRKPYVAIKFLSKEFKQHPDALKALVREFARYEKLSHPNIVRAYELNHMSGTVFMAMEFLSGISLKPFIRSHPNGMPIEEAKPIILGMGKALSFAHKEGIAHLDFKPDNVFYEPEQKLVKIIDFGIARLIKETERMETKFDPGDLKAHTEAYASREMLLGSEQPTSTDDIYALACVTYELLSGKHPFDKKTALKAELEKLSPKPIHGLSKKQNKALLRALTFYRKKRTPTVDQFLAGLFPEKKKSTGLIVGVSAIVLLLLAILGGITWKWTYVPTPKEQAKEVFLEAPHLTEYKRLKQEEDARKKAEIEQARQIAEQEAERMRIAAQAKIAGLLPQCQTHFDALRFTTGIGGTAFDCYQEVLSLYPNNPDAKTGLKAIEKSYVMLVENAIRRGIKSRAEKFLARLEKVNPNSSDLLYFKQRLYPNQVFQVKVQGGYDLLPSKIERGKQIYFDRCASCHGVLRKGGVGSALIPSITRKKGTENLKGSIQFSHALNFGDDLNEQDLDIVARYIQHEPSEPPEYGMEKINASWEVIIPPELRPTQKMNNYDLDNLFAVHLRDVSKVALIDGATKKIIYIIDAGNAVHISRLSASGRYMYIIARDGQLNLVDLWSEIPDTVAETKTCVDARSVDSSKYPGWQDKYVIVGCYWPSQYVILDGKTLEPLRVESTRDIAVNTHEYRREARVAKVIGSYQRPEFLVNVKETGYVLLVNYQNLTNLKVNKVAAAPFLHTGGWDSTKRYFLTTTTDKFNKIVVIDAKLGKLSKIINVGLKPHSGRGANFVDPEFGPVWATSHLGDANITLIGTDPENHPRSAWKVVRTLFNKAKGSLFIKTHPRSKNLYVDTVLNPKEKFRRTAVVFDINNLDDGYEVLPIAEWAGLEGGEQRVVQPEYNARGDEVWFSVWNNVNSQSAIVIVDDKTRQLKHVIKDPRLITPTGKFNFYNTRKDIY